jgi:hypothetical protein
MFGVFHVLNRGGWISQGYFPVVSGKDFAGNHDLRSREATMTLDEFLTALNDVRDRFGWCLVPDAGPGSERRAHPRLHVRAVLLSGGRETVLDPIGAVCYSRTGSVYEPRDWPDAGEVLGMAPRDSAMLVAASSDRTWSGPEGQRERVPMLAEVRDRMVRVLGLREADQRSATAERS